MTKRRSITFFLSLLILFTTAFPVLAQKEPVQIVIDGKTVQTDVDPFIYNNRTYVPARFVTESLGGDIRYNPADEFDPASVVILKQDEYVPLVLYIGKSKALSSEAVYKFDSPPIIRNNRTMLPVRFIASYLDCKVDWDQSTRTVILSKKDSTSIFSYQEFNDTYYDEVSSKKYGNWLMNPNKSMKERSKIFDWAKRLYFE